MEILINTIIGCLSGVISGIIVTSHYKRKQEEAEVHYFWMKYIFDVFCECEMHIPYELKEKSKLVGGVNSEFWKAIDNIEHIRNPKFSENREMSDKEEELIQNAMIALRELSNRKNKIVL